MKNIWIPKLKYADIDSFTTDRGIKLRRVFHEPIRKLIKLGAGIKIFVDNYPQLQKNTPYIFACTHSCIEEIPALLGTIDRSVYSLCGTTEQLDYNPAMYANWLTGVIYVDRLNKYSRKSALPKMERIIKNGSSILMFPEGGWNNTENLLVQNIFPGVYYLHKSTNALIVPVSTYKEFGSKKIFLNFGEPLNIKHHNKNDALLILRDNLATLKYQQIEKHSTRIARSSLNDDIRLSFMQERKKEYLSVKWRHDVWDEELTVYYDKNHPTPVEVQQFVDNIELTKQNLPILYPIIVKRIEDKKYDFKRYMHNTWQQNES